MKLQSTLFYDSVTELLILHLARILAGQAKENLFTQTLTGVAGGSAWWVSVHLWLLLTHFWRHAENTILNITKQQTIMIAW